MMRDEAKNMARAGEGARAAGEVSGYSGLMPGGRDHLPPALGFLLQEFRRLGGRGADRRARQRAVALDDVGQLQRRGDRLRDLAGDLGRRLRRRDDREPAGRIEAREHLGDRRHVRQFRDARRAGDRQRLDLAVADLRQRVGEIVEHHVDMAAEQVGHRRREALVGDVDEIDLGRELEHLAGQMRRGADPGRGEADLASPFAEATSSFSDDARNFGCATSTSGCEAMIETGAKASGSKPSLAKKCWLITSGPAAWRAACSRRARTAPPPRRRGFAPRRAGAR